MTMSRIALDSNVLIYNHCLDCDEKMLKSLNLFDKCPVISTQVISEYLNVMLKKFKTEKNDLMQLCSLWLQKCTIQPVILSTVKLAQDLVKKYDFQVFDGIIIASALEADFDILYSEDLHHDLVVEKSLRIVNPFI